jgi:hypothetical protein
MLIFPEMTPKDPRETMYTPSLQLRRSEEFLRPVGMPIRFEHERQRAMAVEALRIFNHEVSVDMLWIVKFAFLHVRQY